MTAKEIIDLILNQIGIEEKTQEHNLKKLVDDVRHFQEGFGTVEGLRFRTDLIRQANTRLTVLKELLDKIGEVE